MDKKNISFVFNRPTVFPIGGFKVIYDKLIKEDIQYV